eukprot:2795812-Alexandrium_andersonii.AAC.1
MSNLPHARAPAGAREVLEVALDYCFLAKGTNTSDATFTVLVIKEGDSRAILACTALRKGRLRSDALDQA